MAQIHRDPLYIAQHVSDPTFSFTASGAEKTGDVNTAIVDVTGPGVSLRWFVDPQAGKIVRETYKGTGLRAGGHGDSILGVEGG